MANRGETAFDAGTRHYPPHSLLTYTGKIVTPFDMKPEMIDIEDIARALSYIPRFLGHINIFYTVAQHCVEGALNIREHEDGGDDPEYQLAFLLHDASEAYLCDIPSPLKRHPMFSAYRDAEDDLLERIFEKYGLGEWREYDHLRKRLKRVDTRMLSTEKRDIRKTRDHWPCEDDAPAYPRPLMAWRPDHVFGEYVAIFRGLRR